MDLKRDKAADFFLLPATTYGENHFHPEICIRIFFTSIIIHCNCCFMICHQHCIYSEIINDELSADLIQ